jgi:hypothetical protein
MTIGDRTTSSPLMIPLSWFSLPEDNYPYCTWISVTCLWHYIDDMVISSHSTSHSLPPPFLPFGTLHHSPPNSYETTSLPPLLRLHIRSLEGSWYDISQWGPTPPHSVLALPN